MCRLNHIKGLDFLVESFYELSRSGSEAVLAIVGPDEGYRAELERMVSELNLSDRVLFTGFLDGRDKLEALVDADVVVQPSRYEQAAWGPIEAVLCGTPVIVSGGTGSAEDVSTMDAGYLVEYGDKIGMMQTIQMILEDPAAAAEKVNRAREYIVENLAFSSRIADYENLYREVTELNSPVRRNK
jgi:glycosyltransferase involved in cell wall biosynthesis